MLADPIKKRLQLGLQTLYKTKINSSENHRKLAKFTRISCIQTYFQKKTMLTFFNTSTSLYNMVINEQKLSKQYIITLVSTELLCENVFQSRIKLVSTLYSSYIYATQLFDIKN